MTEIDFISKYLQENWNRKPMEELKKQTGLSEGELYFKAYVELKLEKRTIGRGYKPTGLQNEYEVKVRQPTKGSVSGGEIGLSSTITKALGYSAGEFVKYKVVDNTDNITLVLPKKKSLSPPSPV